MHIHGKVYDDDDGDVDDNIKLLLYIHHHHHQFFIHHPHHRRHHNRRCYHVHRLQFDTKRTANPHDGTPGDAKCVTEILGGIKKLGRAMFKYGQLILRKIIKIVATRCHILRLHQIRFRLGLRPIPR